MRQWTEETRLSLLRTLYSVSLNPQNLELFDFCAYSEIADSSSRSSILCASVALNLLDNSHENDELILSQLLQLSCEEEIERSIALFLNAFLMNAKSLTKDRYRWSHSWNSWELFFASDPRSVEILRLVLEALKENRSETAHSTIFDIELAMLCGFEEDVAMFVERFQFHVASPDEDDRDWRRREMNLERAHRLVVVMLELRKRHGEDSPLVASLHQAFDDSLQCYENKGERFPGRRRGRGRRWQRRGQRQSPESEILTDFSSFEGMPVNEAFRRLVLLPERNLMSLQDLKRVLTSDIFQNARIPFFVKRFISNRGNSPIERAVIGIVRSVVRERLEAGRKIERARHCRCSNEPMAMACMCRTCELCGGSTAYQSEFCCVKCSARFGCCCLCGGRNRRKHKNRLKSVCKIS